MGKLKPEDWITLSEAASYLNQLVRADCAPIAEIDLIRYAIGGDLTLSLHTFQSSKATFGHFYPKGSKPPQPETDPPEYLGTVLYLGTDNPDDQLSHCFRVPTYLSDDDDCLGLGEIWEGPAIAIIDHVTSIPAGTWDILRDNTSSEYLSRQLQLCLMDSSDVSIPREINGGDWSMVDPQNKADDGCYQFCLVTEDQQGAALVDLQNILEHSIFCVRPKNLTALFEDEPSEKLEQPSERHKSKSERQREMILETLQNRLNLDPLNLPERKEGPHKGSRALCWDILKNNRQLFTEHSFKAAWKKLRRNGEIMGGN
tara:strand:+ start:2505 stop:3446 length:942 start_codon:yes stop_codon:yes gene_type:complete